MFNKRDMNGESGGKALGLVSIGIGLTELAAPRLVETMLGLEHRRSHRGVLQILGMRELMHGVGILTAKNENGELASGIWARVAGDLLDTAMLGVAATKTSRPLRLSTVAIAVAGIGIADLYYALKTSG